MNDMRNVCLPEHLCRAAEARFGARFASIDDLVISMLKELLRDESATLDARELEVIEQRLRALGYV